MPSILPKRPPCGAGPVRLAGAGFQPIGLNRYASYIGSQEAGEVDTPQRLPRTYRKLNDRFLR